MTQLDASNFYDDRAAIAEGWAIFYAEGNSEGTIWQLQRLDPGGDGPHVFDSDKEAHEFVWSRYLLGSKNHVAAINFLKEHEPREYRNIKTSAENVVFDRLRRAEESAGMWFVSACDLFATMNIRQAVDLMDTTSADTNLSSLHSIRQTALELAYAQSQQCSFSGGFTIHKALAQYKYDFLLQLATMCKDYGSFCYFARTNGVKL